MNSDKTTHHNYVTEQPACGCIYDCPDVYNFLRLTDELIHTILEREEEIIRCARRLSNIFHLTGRKGFARTSCAISPAILKEKPAYDFYVNYLCGDKEPQQDKARLARLRRLMNGTDETSITYL